MTASIASAMIVISLGTWIGAIIFQSAVVAPLVFRTLNADAAGRFLRALFPRFFRFGLLCGSAFLGAVLLMVAGSGWDEPAVLLLAAAVTMIACQFAALALVPAINAARDAGSAGTQRFRRLHGLSVLLILVILVTAVGILVTSVSAAAIAVGH